MSYNAPPPPPPGDWQGQQPGGYGAQPPAKNGKALWAMILGILSICCIGVLAGIPAIILGKMAEKEIAASGGMQSGAGQAKAGWILGVISCVLSVIYLILVLTGALDFSGAFDTNL